MARGAKPGQVRAKHLRAEPPEPADGTRILVSRYYPRGIRKAAKLWDEWRPELGPSRALHGDIKEERIGWDEYDRRFLMEMGGRESSETLAKLTQRVQGGETITLLCDHPRTMAQERCHRFLVQRLVEERAQKYLRGDARGRI